MDSSESNTQCDPLYLNTFVDPDFSEIMQVEELKEPEPWCRLVSRNAATPQFELKYIDNVEKRTMTVSSDSTNENGNSSLLDITGSNSGDESTNKRLHVHTIGRSSHCSIKFENYSRISNRHCSIFCKQNFSDPSNPFLEAWIEDTSANGTIINKERLKKNVPRLLHNGDELHLINPELARIHNSGITAEDVTKHSFTITLNLPSPLDTIGKNQASEMSAFDISAMQNIEIGSSSSSSADQTRNMLVRNSTVHRLLNQNRNINDYYVLKELLGSGAAGLVYRSISKETGRDWAVKIVDTRQLVIASSTTQEITKEAELLRSLRHPNIIHLEDIFSSGNNIYLVMELSVGGDLFDRITKKKAYSEHEAKEVTRQILGAMVYMHENKVAHRDLKPENILLARKDSDVDIKITDFGLAKKLDDKGGLKSYCGTPQYYAP
jgi:tRNA A-37 threonylcarbamoyl transferase component Bud32